MAMIKRGPRRMRRATKLRPSKRAALLAATREESDLLELQPAAGDNFELFFQQFASTIDAENPQIVLACRNQQVGPVAIGCLHGIKIVSGTSLAGSYQSYELHLR